MTGLDVRSTRVRERYHEVVFAAASDLPAGRRRRDVVGALIDDDELGVSIDLPVDLEVAGQLHDLCAPPHDTMPTLLEAAADEIQTVVEQRTVAGIAAVCRDVA